MQPQKHILFILFFALFLSPALGQEASGPRTLAELPKVFLIGEYESMYAKLYKNYPGLLISESANDMETAFNKWLNLIYSMEDKSHKMGLDLKGLKIWIHVFFDKSGKIDHIMFHKKPHSKQVDNEELRAFLKDFIEDYTLSIKSEQNFMHSGSASFPTYGYAPLEANSN